MDLFLVDRFANGLRLNGVNQYVRIPNVPSLQFLGKGPATISVFFRLKAVAQTIYKRDTLWMCTDIANQLGFDIYQGRPRIAFVSNPIGSNHQIMAASQLIFPNVVYHYAAVVENNQISTFRLYLNGQRITNLAVINSSDHVPQNTTGDFLLGLQPEDKGEYLNGDLYSVKLYNQALSDAQIARLYQKQNQVFDLPGSVIDFRFYEKSGKLLRDHQSVSNGLLTNYTDAETASNGQPQSGNTAWVSPYTQLPVTK